MAFELHKVNSHPVHRERDQIYLTVLQSNKKWHKNNAVCTQNNDC